MFEVGDKVRIKKDLKIGDGLGWCKVIEEMLKYAGKETIIKEKWKNLYKIKIDGGIWNWTKEMLEPKKERNEI